MAWIFRQISVPFIAFTGENIHQYKCSTLSLLGIILVCFSLTCTEIHWGLKFKIWSLLQQAARWLQQALPLASLLVIHYKPAANEELVTTGLRGESPSCWVGSPNFVLQLNKSDGWEGLQVARTDKLPSKGSERFASCEAYMEEIEMVEGMIRTCSLLITLICLGRGLFV